MYSEKFKLAFAEVMDERILLLDDISDYRFPYKFEQRMKKLFNHPYSYIIVKNRPVPLRKILICAINIILIITLSLTTAAYWEEIKSFFMEVFADHTRVIHAVDDDFPKIIESVYEPDYIPSGFILKNNDVNILSTYLYYSNGEDFFSISQFTINVVSNVNSELSDIEIIIINGYEGYYLEYDNEINFTWTTDEYTFTIIGNICLDEILKIAESVR